MVVGAGAEEYIHVGGGKALVVLISLYLSYQRVLCVFFRLKILYKNFIILKITTLIVAYLILVDQTLK